MKSSSILDQLSLVVDIPYYFFRSTTAFGFHPLIAARRMAASLRDRYVPREAFSFGLLSTNPQFYAPRMYVSRARMAQVQHRLNPRSLEWLLSDKGMFYRFCASAGIPVPKLYGILFSASAGWAAPCAVLASREAMLAFIHDLPGEFVVVPARPSYGSGAGTILHRGDRFTGPGPGMVDAEELLDRLTARKPAGGWLVHERLANHGILTLMSGTTGLQTVRLMTFADRRGNVRVVGAFFPVVQGENRTRRVSSRTPGNILAEVSLDDGRITRGFVFSRNGRGAVTVHTHPVTSHRIAGVQLPFWQEALDLVCNAGGRFLPIRTVGWDVALTDGGPVLVGGDVWYDPPCHIEGFLATFEMQ